MVAVDPAFKSIKPTEAKFLIWRIENFEVKPVPRDHYGSFFEGDSYIVYSAGAVGNFGASQVKSSETAGKLGIHIHFWLGAETSTDESTTAAIKTVELDEYLGGSPTQHREVQGHESDRFKSYFKSGIRILKGGVSTGFKHVTDEFSTRLFKIEGKRSPVLTHQSSVSWEYFNSGSAFILETRHRIFVWIGKESNKMERLQAAKVAVQLRDELNNRTIHFLDEDRESELTGEELKNFQENLSLKNRVIKPAEADTNDAKGESSTRSEIKLYRCTDEDGTCKIIEVKDGPLKQADISSNDSFIIDNNVNGIWVWIGKKASAEERKQGMINAHGFLKKKNYPSTTRVTKVVDGAEPTEFKMLFVDWKDPNSASGFGRQQSLSRIAKTVNTKFDAKTLHDSPALAADTQMVDDGTGRITIWRLHNKELETVSATEFGVFFSGDCYLIHYIYEVNGKQNHILYFWLGAHSSQDERGIIAWHTVKKDDELNGAAVQVRVVQSKEPPHFLTIFKGKMIIFNGGYASSFDGNQGQDVGLPSTFLIHVRGGEDHNTRSVQVDLRAASLNSNDVFVMCTRQQSYVWCGKGSTGDEREKAKAIAEQWTATKNYVVIFEGQEKEDFWELIGGREPYANDERLANPEINIPARLFHCSNATGTFKAEEVVNFTQNDLVSDDVMVLDTGKAVFIWIGQGANKDERLEATKLVHDYLQSDPRGRDMDTPIIQVQQNHEPPNFTGFFGVWDAELWENSTYDKLKKQIEKETEAAPVIINGNEKHDSDNLPKYALHLLTHKTPEELPEDVDVLNKEKYITDEDFIAAFGMQRQDYEALPVWRRNNLKKAAGLF